MRNRMNAAATLLAAFALALGLAACGSEEATTTSTAMAFDSQPASEVWIDGTARGTTPVTIALEPGTHDVIFKAEGFKDETFPVTVEAGVSQTISAPLVAASADDGVALATLAKALNVDMETPEAITRHRGASDSPITLFWPRKNMRQEGVQTYRIDVSDEYEGDGVLKFFVRGKEVHSEPFDPEGMVTVAPLPHVVLDNLKIGRTVKWGVYYEGRNRKKSVTTSFKIGRADKVEKRIAKLENSRHFMRQTPLTQELLRTEVLKDYKFYAEALVNYLGILQAWDDTTQPFRGIVITCRRLDLDETELFEIASQFVSGKGQRPSAGAFTKPGVTVPGGTPGVSPRMRQQLSAPKIAAFGANKGMTTDPAPEAAGPKVRAGLPGTPEAEQAIAVERLSASARELESHASALDEQAEQLKQEAAEAEKAQQELGAIAEKQAQAEKDYLDAQEAHAAAPTDEAAKQTAEDLAKAEQAFNAATQEREAAEQAMRDNVGNTGMSPAEMRAEAEQAADRAEQARAEAAQARELVQAGQEGRIDGSQLVDGAQQVEQGVSLLSLQREYEEGQKYATAAAQNLADAQNAYDNDPSPNNAADLAEAAEAYDHAVAEAQNALEALRAGGTPEQLDPGAAEQLALQGQYEAARADAEKVEAEMGEREGALNQAAENRDLVYANVASTDQEKADADRAVQQAQSRLTEVQEAYARAREEAVKRLKAFEDAQR